LRERKLKNLGGGGRKGDEGEMYVEKTMVRNDGGDQVKQGNKENAGGE